MKKYKIVKWLVFGIAVFAIINFCLPFARYQVSFGGTSSGNADWVAWENEWRPRLGFNLEGMYLGFHFVAGIYNNMYIDSAVGVWVTRVSFVIAIAAVVLSVISLVSKDSNGLNKHGNVHRTLVFSVALSCLSALANLISMIIAYQVDGSSGSGTSYDITFHYERHFNQIYSYAGFIIIAIAATVAVFLLVRSMWDIAVMKNNIVASPTASTVTASVSSSASSVSRQTASMGAGNNTSSIRRQTAAPTGRQNNYVEDKPMTKKDAEGLLAYIWVRQYNTLPFEEASEKIMAYLIENKYVVTPETKADYVDSVSADSATTTTKTKAAQSGSAASVVESSAEASKNLRLARQAREDGNSEDAKLFYGKVREEDPDSGEAKFYYAYYSLQEGTNGELPQRFENLCTILSISVKRITESALDREEQLEIIEGIVTTFVPETSAEIRYMRHKNVEDKIGDSYVKVFETSAIDRVRLAGADALKSLGDQIDALYDNDPECKRIAIIAWEGYIELLKEWLKDASSNDIKLLLGLFKELGDQVGDDPACKTLTVEAWSMFVKMAQKYYAYVEKGEAEAYTAKIQKLDPSFVMPKKSGCISFGKVQ